MLSKSSRAKSMCPVCFYLLTFRESKFCSARKHVGGSLGQGVCCKGEREGLQTATDSSGVCLSVILAVAMIPWVCTHDKTFQRVHSTCTFYYMSITSQS